MDGNEKERQVTEGTCLTHEDKQNRKADSIMSGVAKNAQGPQSKEATKYHTQLGRLSRSRQETFGHRRLNKLAGSQ